MSDRLAKAVVGRLKEELGANRDDSWLLLEGIPEALAESLVANWDESLPRLFVVGPPENDFDGRALGDTPPTAMRNTGAMCLAVCSGHGTSDGQSLTGFAKFSPDDLVKTRSGIELIAEQQPSVVDIDGVPVLVKALTEDKLDQPPTAAGIAALFNALASGSDLGSTLPNIGGFKDHSECEESRMRIVDNLNLALSRSSGDRMKPSSIRAIRARASAHTPASGISASDLVESLQDKDPSILEMLTYDEALLILEGPPPENIVDVVKRELDAAREKLPEESGTIHDLYRRTPSLSNRAEARLVAADLLRFDRDFSLEVLTDETRKRLKKLARERSISGRSLEEGLLRAVASLSSPPTSIELREPKLTEASSDAQMLATLSIAAGKLRAMPILSVLKAAKVTLPEEIEALSPDRVLGALMKLGSNLGRTGKPLVFLVRGETRADAIEVRWTPFSEDFELLGLTHRFAQNPPALSLASTSPVSSRVAYTSVSARRSTGALEPLGEALAKCAAALLEFGFEPESLLQWLQTWKDFSERAAHEKSFDVESTHELPFAGSVRFESGEIALTHLSPPKAEWLADKARAWKSLAVEALEVAAGDESDSSVIDGLRALGETTSSGYPSYLLEYGGEQPYTVISEGELLSYFGPSEAEEVASHIGVSGLRVALSKLAILQPEASGELKCVAYGDSACDLLTRTVVDLMKGSDPVSRRVEITCVDGTPSGPTLISLDEQFARSQHGDIAIRYTDRKSLATFADRGNLFHVAVSEGISRDPRRLRVNIETVPEPPSTDEVLFIPKTWVRPGGSDLLLLPPALTALGRTWYELATRIECAGSPPEPKSLRIPEVRIELNSAKGELIEMHDIATWVVTVDRFATRASIQKACGDEIAIVHQERRVNGTTTHGLVISQKIGATADRAIERSLKKAKLVEETSLQTIARGLRIAAVRAYGILALRAATTGSGVNELIGHVAGFHRLVSMATPWPLPEDSKVILVSLDEYSNWFGVSERADMLALALSTEEIGVYGANVEVKAVRSAEQTSSAMSSAKRQLKQTLQSTRVAARPNDSFEARLWLNRIAEAAIGTAREQGLRLKPEELASIEAFRSGHGTLEWAAVGMVFAPNVEDQIQHVHIELDGDRVPIALCQVNLSADLLHQSVSSDATNLRTIAAARPAQIGGTRTRKTLEKAKRTGVATGAENGTEPGSLEETEPHAGPEQQDATTDDPAVLDPETPPLLGWDVDTGDEVRWHVQGSGALSNGHVEIYGTSGAGKTQFLMSLLAQMKGAGSHFGVCDFKNDYAGTFPDDVRAKFFDMWNETLPYNPLSLDDKSRRARLRLFIELRDTVEIAAKPYVRLGPRQLHKLQDVFEKAYDMADVEGRIPTLKDVHDLLDDDLSGVIGDLTETELFGAGPALGSLVEEDAIFGLNHIPGTGLTATLASGFILSALYLRILEMPQVANRVNYVLAIDEAHRVANFYSVGNMIRELRSKGLAVILATQKPGDLPEEASTNAQTKIFMRLPDAASAKLAAKTLDPADRELPKLIRSLEDGVAFASFGGSAPRLIKLRQFWRDG